MGPSIKVKYYDVEATISVDSPNLPLRDLLEKAKAALNIPVGKTNVEFRYKQKSLDLLLPFRLSGILTNSTVEVVETLVMPSSTQQPNLGTGDKRIVQVALDFGQAGGRPRVEGSFPPQTSLKEIVALLAGDVNVFKSARFMNQRIEHTQFETTTLHSLGLTQGSAMFRMESAPPAAATSTAASSMPAAPSSVTPVPPTAESSKMEVEEEKTVSRSLSLVAELREHIRDDSEIRTAIVTLMKIVRNVYLNPTDDKVRSLRTSNPALKIKLKDAPPCFRLLESAGFSALSKDGESLYAMTHQPDLPKLKRIFESELRRAADEIGVPLAERPALDTPLVVQATQTQPSPVEFDPFKTTVIGMSTAPSLRFGASGAFTLDQQVVQLKAKRDEIMRSAGATVADRSLVAIAHSSDFNPRRFLAADDGDEEDERQGAGDEDYDADERSVLAQHARAMQEKQKKAENFQTKAMREYEQLSKARVYTRTLIRISFPDRSVLQGLFCPLETVSAIHDAIVSACPGVQKTDFTLLTGPPPQRLDPNATLESLGLYPAASLQLSSPVQEKLMIRQELFSIDPGVIHVRVPKGEPLIPKPVTSRSSVAAGGKPKWLKL